MSPQSQPCVSTLVDHIVNDKTKCRVDFSITQDKELTLIVFDSRQRCEKGGLV